MVLTPEALARHELCGLHARVTDARNRSLVGIEGRIVRESERTLSFETKTDEKQIPKSGATFEFALASETVAPADIAYDPASAATYVTIKGERLVANPARRTERKGDSTWR
jgi:ribonuclease P protein subunit POP4